MRGACVFSTSNLSIYLSTLAAPWRKRMHAPRKHAQMASANETRHCAWLVGMRLVRPPTWCSHVPREQCEATALRLGDSRFNPCVLAARGGRCVSAWPGGIRCASTPGTFSCSTCARPSAQLVREARHAIERRRCTWGALAVELWLLAEPRGSKARPNPNRSPSLALALAPT